MIPRLGSGGAPAKPGYIYLLQSTQDGSFYVGWTTDLVRRLVEHNQGLSSYTRRKRPWKLIGAEQLPTPQAAQVREQLLKRSPRSLHSFKKRLLNQAALSGLCQGVG